MKASRPISTILTLKLDPETTLLKLKDLFLEKKEERKQIIIWAGMPRGLKSSKKFEICIQSQQLTEDT